MFEELEFIQSQFNLVNDRFSIIDSIKLKIQYVILNTKKLDDFKTQQYKNNN